MKIKNPHNRLYIFAGLAILEMVLLVFIMTTKDIDYSSFDELVSSQVLLISILTLSFSVQSWKAYQDIQKNEK